MEERHEPDWEMVFQVVPPITVGMCDHCRDTIDLCQTFAWEEWGRSITLCLLCWRGRLPQPAVRILKMKKKGGKKYRLSLPPRPPKQPRQTHLAFG